ncbi:MAG TPA: DUF6795 domain-containing protein [Rhodanobacter sp.]|nr:DUF6795 domain-containing protein [Rhodanobacter sp.]
MEVVAGSAMTVLGNGRDALRGRELLKPRAHWRLLGAGLLPVLLVCVLFWTTADEANAMGKMCLFSAVKGVVLNHGEPVQGARIERSYKWAWKDRSGGDQTVTDDKGEFALPAIWGHSLLGSLLPHEPVVDETMLIQHGGQTYKAWMFTRGNYTENGELNGRPIVLVCRLEAEVTHHDQVYGMCEPQ